MTGANGVFLLSLAFMCVAYSTSQDCLKFQDPEACLNLPDGDYNVCPPDCQKGHFLQCTNGRAVQTICADGRYRDGQGNFIIAPLVFDPQAKFCLEGSLSCSRDLDDNVIRGK